MKLALQAGHQNIKFNSIATLHGSTGAPNEASFNLDVCNQLAAKLRSAGFEVTQTDANGNDDPNITGTDWDLFLAIHYDADVYSQGGGFVAFPEPSTDGATDRSQAIASALKSEYFATTGIVNHPERKNANTDYYYMWQYLSDKTPCVLIECGVGMHIPDDHSVLHGNRQLVIEGLYRGIMRAFGQQQTPAPSPETPTAASEAPVAPTDQTKIYLGPELGFLEIQAIRSEISDLRREKESLTFQKEQLFEKISSLNKTVDSLNKQLTEAKKNAQTGSHSPKKAPETASTTSTPPSIPDQSLETTNRLREWILKIFGL